MKKLNIDLENCYGIRKLRAELDFEQYGDVFAIYAPNGVMKTSLANTFKDISESKVSRDRIWPDNITKRAITIETGDEPTAESIFVIEPYNENYRSNRISALLVNDDLRKQYSEVHEIINEKTEDLIKNLKTTSGLKKDIREELSIAITHNPNDFYKALGRVRNEVEEDPETLLGDVFYSDIFNPKVEAILSDQNFLTKIHEYMNKYDELVSRSTFFRKGVFTHNNASDIAKNLNSNGFFRANHSVYLRIKGEKVEVSSLDELESAIQVEKDVILTDPGLKTAFESIDKMLEKNAELKKFRNCLEKNQIVIPELVNPGSLRQKLWIQYLIRAKDSYTAVLTAYNKGKDRIASIVEEAKAEKTKWAEVIDIFNDRFSVPFVVRMGNQEDVILKSDAPSICFDFRENPEDVTSPILAVNEADLKAVLSNGEKRALYILNIIFEIEARKRASQGTLFIVDDIADSFDYKNKYAIIEYLSDVGSWTGFKMVILSHNFDFFRTVSGRLRLKREARKLASKENGIIILHTEFYQKSPFAHWKTRLANDASMLIAAVPFLRNLAEYSGDDDSYQKLTSLLHIKEGTDTFFVADLQLLIKKILHDQTTLALGEPALPVIDLIFREAASMAISAVESCKLEEKIVLSIAIRLKAEKFMIQRIADDQFWKGITSSQTPELMKRYRLDFPAETQNIKLLNQVNLMTPENIHLNSFMYEPILDLSSNHLKKLFLEVSALSDPPA